MKELQEIDDLDLRYGDLNVLDAFDDSASNFAFQGLKRKLGIHQETLSRALRRLESDQLVEHTEDGYRLTLRGLAVTGKSPKGGARSLRILETYLPSDIEASELISKLKYTWFSALRWFGYKETGEGAILTWLTEDGNTQIKAHFQGARLFIEIDSDDDEKLNVAITFAHELMNRIFKEYQQVKELTQNPQAQAVQYAVALTRGEGHN